MADWMTAAVDIQPLYTGSDWNAVEARANYWLKVAVARAQTVASCFQAPDQLPQYIQDAAKGIIANAVLRLLDDSKGATQYQAAGPFSVNTDTKLRSDRILSIADRDELRQLCRKVRRRRRGGVIRTPIGY